MNQCPGCGFVPTPKKQCVCTPVEIRAQLEKDRAVLSDRAAGHTKRANDAARLLRIAMPYVGAETHEAIETWLNEGTEATR